MRLFELGNERPSLDKEFPRNIMPQIRIEHLKDSPFQTEHVKELTANLKPVQTQRVKGMVDKAKRGFADGTIRPIIVDRDNYIVNGHHRYDVARGTELDRVNVIRVDATIEELIKHFSNTASQEPTMKEQLQAKLDLAIRLREAKRIDENFGRDKEWYNKQKGKRKGNIFISRGHSFDPEEKYHLTGYFASIGGASSQILPRGVDFVKGKDISKFIKDFRYDYNYIVLQPLFDRYKDMHSLAGYPDPDKAKRTEEGKSPHKKGTKKYKKHMAAMHAESQGKDKPKQNNPVAKHSRNMAGAGAHKSPKDYDRKNKKKDISSQLDEGPYIASRSDIVHSVMRELEAKAHVDDNFLHHLAELVGKKLTQRNQDNHRGRWVSQKK
jgi:hypothetical protein